jgi:hypothetical protein
VANLVGDHFDRSFGCRFRDHVSHPLRIEARRVISIKGDRA